MTYKTDYKPCDKVKVVAEHYPDKMALIDKGVLKENNYILTVKYTMPSTLADWCLSGVEVAFEEYDYRLCASMIVPYDEVDEGCCTPTKDNKPSYAQYVRSCVEALNKAIVEANNQGINVHVKVDTDVVPLDKQNIVTSNVSVEMSVEIEL